MRFWLITAVITILAWGGPVFAGDQPSAGSVTNTATGESHGWFAALARKGAMVYHLPPRGADLQGQKGAEDGSLRLAATLEQLPSAIAARDNMLYMAFAPTVVRGGEVRRQVLMVKAERGSLDNSWVGGTDGDRLTSLPALPGDGDLRGMAGSPAGPVALMTHRGSEGTRDQLLVQTGGTWEELDLPDDWRHGERGVRLIGTDDGIAIAFVAEQRTGVWKKSLPGRNRSGASQRSGEWVWVPLSLGEAIGARGLLPEQQVLWVRGQFIVDRRRGQQVELWAAAANGARRVANIEGVSSGYALVPLDETGRVALVWRSGTSMIPGKPDAADLPEKTRIVEVSAMTGQVLFDGLAESQGPFSQVELKVLAVFVVGVMLAIVVFVLRSDGERPPLSLPKGVSLAEPGRRMLAGMADVGLAVIVASKLTGIPVGDAFTIGALTGKIDLLMLYLATIGVGFLLGTLGEWLFGRSVGKALTGCETVSPVFAKSDAGQVSPEVRRVSLLRAVIRNSFKWLIPPVAMAGVSSPERRHRGDMAAGTAVIVRDEAPAE